MTTPTTERIFVIGATGNCGSKAVKDLVAKNASVTVYARTPSKVTEIFSENPLISVVQGDINDLATLKDALKGHTRLFLLYGNIGDFVEKKVAIAKLAYAAGIKQIVDISALNASESWRAGHIGVIHRDTEEGILGIPDRGTLVALRPGRFMSNYLTFEGPSDGVVRDTASEDQPQGWISPNDIGAVAAAVLLDDIEKHGDIAYELVGDVLTPNELVAITSRVLERPVSYQKIIGRFPHAAAYQIAASIPSRPPTTTISTGIPILIGREPETFEQFLSLNKAQLL
ncbi:hypothetical protein MBANPS3_005987 [Mucor bainieri]